jgi:tRNA1(Val) A37 N6-methylase TrmN6
VYERANKHIRTILCLGLKPGESQLKQLILKTESGKISEAFRHLMQDFYLENTDVYKVKKQAN